MHLVSEPLAMNLDPTEIDELLSEIIEEMMMNLFVHLVWLILPLTIVISAQHRRSTSIRWTACCSFTSMFKSSSSSSIMWVQRLKIVILIQLLLNAILAVYFPITSGVAVLALSLALAGSLFPPPLGDWRIGTFYAGPVNALMLGQAISSLVRTRIGVEHCESLGDYCQAQSCPGCTFFGVLLCVGLFQCLLALIGVFTACKSVPLSKALTDATGQQLPSLAKIFCTLGSQVRDNFGEDELLYRDNMETFVSDAYIK